MITKSGLTQDELQQIADSLLGTVEDIGDVLGELGLFANEEAVKEDLANLHNSIERCDECETWCYWDDLEDGTCYDCRDQDDEEDEEECEDEE